MATTVKNEAIKSVSPMTFNAVSVEDADGRIINTMYKGLASKPTPRSETARLRSNVFKGFGNDEVFAHGVNC